MFPHQAENYIDPIPTAQEQLKFLNQVQYLLQNGRSTTTYKYALLMSLVRLSIEKGDNSGKALFLSADDIAEKFIEIYWQQSRPFQFESDQPFILNQHSNRNQQAKIINLINDVYPKPTTLVSLQRNPKQWQALKNSVINTVLSNPIERLQEISGKTVPFLYHPNHANKQGLLLLPKVMYSLRQFSNLIEELCQKKWMDSILLYKKNEHLLNGIQNLQQFLFEYDRNQLTKIAPILKDIQENHCFYCNKTITGKQAVDHFIPWSMYPSDTGHNFVLADHACNSDKSNLLADIPFYERWKKRNDIHNNVIQTEIEPLGFITNLHDSNSIAKWAYDHARESQYQLWQGRDLV